MPNYKAVLKLPSFQSTKFSITDPKPVSNTREIPGYGNFTYLSVVFEFRRRIASSLVNTYIPSLLIVCLSWVSFWLDPDAVPGRVTLGVTALLTLATQIVHSRSDLPSLDYMTAVDVWLFACMLMVFLSLIEFTAANVADRKAKQVRTFIDEDRRTRLRHSPRLGCSPDNLSNSSITSAISGISWLKREMDARPATKRSRVRKWTRKTILSRLNPLSCIRKTGLQETSSLLKDNIFDRTARILFPLVMLAFSVMYWTYLLYV